VVRSSSIVAEPEPPLLLEPELKFKKPEPGAGAALRGRLWLRFGR